jgi:Arc/MetJ family transcription regulator
MFVEEAYRHLLEWAFQRSKELQIVPASLFTLGNQAVKRWNNRRKHSWQEIGIFALRI